MGKLYDLIQEHMDRQPYGVSVRRLAKDLGVTQQTVANWREPKRLVAKEHLQTIARVTGVPYLRVLDALLYDIGYLPKDGDGDDRDSRGAASMNAPGSLSDRRSKVTGTDLSGLPSVAHKRTKKRDDDD